MVMREIDCFRIRLAERAAGSVADLGVCAPKTHTFTNGTRTFGENDPPDIAHVRSPKGAPPEGALAL